MKKQRADEIVRLTFYRHIDYIADSLKECENKAIEFDVGRYLGMMQRDLENELAKEVEE